MQISFEFFPPKNPQSKAQLKQVRTELLTLSPEYFSITFGAGGSTQDATLETVLDITQNDGVPATPHISCIGTSKEKILALLTTYQQNNINRLVVLRGDLPDGVSVLGDFHYASELVAFIREKFGDYFYIQVAAYPEKHPESNNINDDIQQFANKMHAGANGAITQYFYNVDAYRYFVDKAQDLGVTGSIVPGIMPITNYTQLVKFSQLSGAQIPQWISNQLEARQNDLPSLRAFGLEVVANLCEQLKNQGVNEFHFYSMNRVEPVKTLARQLY